MFVGPIRIDLRGLTVDQVLERLEIYGIRGDYKPSDATHLFTPPLKYWYEKVVCVSLRRSWALEGHSIVTIPDYPDIYYVLWNGNVRQHAHDHDLYGFILSNGAIEWGRRNTPHLWA